MKCQVHFLIAIIILLKGSFVYAQTPGSWLLRTGAITVSPQVTSGCLSAPDFSDSPDGCTKAGVSRNTQPGGGITWIMSQHLSLDMPLALPFTHEVSGEGAMKGSGTIAEIQSLPLTLFPQYRFFGSRSMFRPYFGLGMTYAYFFNPQGSGRLTATTNPRRLQLIRSSSSHHKWVLRLGSTANFMLTFFIARRNFAAASICPPDSTWMLILILRPSVSPWVMHTDTDVPPSSWPILHK